VLLHVAHVVGGNGGQMRSCTATEGAAHGARDVEHEHKVEVRASELADALAVETSAQATPHPVLYLATAFAC
jgi:hypothetical protein